MPRTHLTPAELQELHALAADWGKIIARRTGDDALAFDLDALEHIAQAAAAGLVEGTLPCLLQRQADGLGDQQPCPACPGGAEAILQVRAAYLSEEDRLHRSFTQRPGNPYRRRAA